MAIRKGDLKPGDGVSMDQYESTVRGRLPNTKGKSAWRNKYWGGTIFVDHASGKVKACHQITLGASDTVRAKRKFEQEVRMCGHQVKGYHGDNGIFKSASFQEDLIELEQTINYSGVGAHHQNGVAEQAIQTVVERARAMMIHVALHWPNEAHTDLWPMAMDYSVFLWNHTPDRLNGLSPEELFCGTRLDCGVLRASRVWGSPSYVLDPTLQDGKKIPKWKPRSRRGQFLGMSLDHASSIGLIRNVRTGHISPQFHVIYDEKFTTVSRGDDAVNLHLWYELVTNHCVYYPDGDEVAPGLADEWLDQAELAHCYATPACGLRAPVLPPVPVPPPDPPNVSLEGDVEVEVTRVIQFEPEFAEPELAFEHERPDPNANELLHPEPEIAFPDAFPGQGSDED
jgi:hypothetical protein